MSPATTVAPRETTTAAAIANATTVHTDPELASVFHEPGSSPCRYDVAMPTARPRTSAATGQRGPASRGAEREPHRRHVLVAVPLLGRPHERVVDGRKQSSREVHRPAASIMRPMSLTTPSTANDGL